ncbi:MAG: hypothetical protein K2N44_09485 [Lachnospiraceae bacterium]|nr:hypothetical protein [Lachnospiraceae bacterium]
MVDATNTTSAQGVDGIDDNNRNVITADKAYKMIGQELSIANNIGTEHTAAKIFGADGATAVTGATEVVDADGKNAVFIINKGKANVKVDLSFSLHVGADADMTYEIGVTINALDTTGLGIKGLNVSDSTGSSATYAIADAVSKVSAQRSLFGAVQNRLEHTINNLDNVVENTTAAESQIRETVMATEMVKYSNANILSQAGQSMLAQGNQSNQGVLSLLG